jgi:hypothetical protein
MAKAADRKFKDPVGKRPPQVRRSQPVTPAAPDGEYSWMGKWADNGYSVRISPRLSSLDWDKVHLRADECWDTELRRYSEIKTMELLAELFPTHELVIVWPKCTHRERAGGLRNGDGQMVRPWFTVCGQVAKHTELALRDVYDNRFALPRCAEHQGEL